MQCAFDAVAAEGRRLSFVPRQGGVVAEAIGSFLSLIPEFTVNMLSLAIKCAVTEHRTVPDWLCACCASVFRQELPQVHAAHTGDSADVLLMKAKQVTSSILLIFVMMVIVMTTIAIAASIMCL